MHTFLGWFKQMIHLNFQASDTGIVIKETEKWVFILIDRMSANFTFGIRCFQSIDQSFDAIVQISCL